jgi:ligand-binding SRPBCC domain-containing protein
MQIILKTKVEKDVNTVFDAFDLELFKKLKPPGIGLKVLRFDGCKTGDKVELELHFGLFKQKWKSVITDSGADEHGFYFIDEAYGKDLPFFLSHWKHRHIIAKDGEETVITDHINFKSPWGLSFLFYPAVWLQMAMRKPVYQKTFRKESDQRQ